MPAIKMQPPLEVDRRKFQFPIKRNRPMVHPQHTQRQFSATALSRLRSQQPHRLRSHALAADIRRQTNPQIRRTRLNLCQHKPARPSASTTQNAPWDHRFAGESMPAPPHPNTRTLQSSTAAGSTHHSAKPPARKNPISPELAIGLSRQNISNSGSGSAANSVCATRGLSPTYNRCTVSGKASGDTIGFRAGLVVVDADFDRGNTQPLPAVPSSRE